MKYEKMMGAAMFSQNDTPVIISQLGCSVSKYLLA